MNTALLLLAIAGFAAVALRAAMALLSALRRGVDAFVAQDVAERRARSGDLTGLEDAAAVRSLARRRRLVALSFFSMWAGLLIVPSLTPWPRFLYALYSLLWLVPRQSASLRHP